MSMSSDMNSNRVNLGQQKKFSVNFNGDN
jgi:hypothetical protein